MYSLIERTLLPLSIFSSRIALRRFAKLLASSSRIALRRFAKLLACSPVCAFVLPWMAGRPAVLPLAGRAGRGWLARCRLRACNLREDYIYI
jgi:hypothetical protein